MFSETFVIRRKLLSCQGHYLPYYQTRKCDFILVAPSDGTALNICGLFLNLSPLQVTEGKAHTALEWKTHMSLTKQMSCFML